MGYLPAAKIARASHPTLTAMIPVLQSRTSVHAGQRKTSLPTTVPGELARMSAHRVSAMGPRSSIPNLSSRGSVGYWDKRLTSFQKLVFIKAYQEEKVSALRFMNHALMRE